MKHYHEKSNQYFEVGEYRDGDKTYDITIISYWKDAETQGVGSPVEIIGYYFGDYDEETTNFYIDKWIENREKETRVLRVAKEYLDAYLITNEDVLEKDIVSTLQESLVECDELLYDRSWFLEDNLPSAFLMKRAEYLRYIEMLMHQGYITEGGLEELKELAINFEE